MITLPEDFIETKYPGYFWSLTENWLYSIKSGVLKPIKKTGEHINYYRDSDFVGWKVSHLGKRCYLSEEYLLSCARKHKYKPAVEQNHVIPVWRKFIDAVKKFAS